jgi:hypothetical protein
MTDEIMLTIGEDGKASLYDDTYDITIHCESQEEQDEVKRVLQNVPHWIPVTERLPETTDAVLTTYIVNGDRSRRYVEESSYYGNDESWSSPWDEYRIVGTRIEVIAWMPLPEAFKGETE